MKTRTLRILVTCDWFSPDTGGGAERVAAEVAERLAAKGHQITVLATSPRGQRAFALPSNMDLMPVRAYSLSRVLRAQASVAPELAWSTGKVIAASHPDVIWGHSLQFQTTMAAAAWARRRRVPFVVTAHIGDLTAVAGAVGLAARVHEKTIGRLILRSATRAIAVSDPVAMHIQSLAPRLPIDVVPNGVDLERFRPGVPRHGDVLRVGFMGRLVPNKGPDIALRAIADAVRLGVDVELSIAGAGPEETDLRRLAHVLGVEQRVRFEGHRPDPEVWLRGIDLLVRPSLTEGMPLGLLEAMAVGVPVIASDIPGNAWLIRATGAGLLVPVADHEALARAIATLWRQPEIRDEMRAAGIQAAASFSWDRTSTLTEATLRRAVDGLERVPSVPFADSVDGAPAG